MDTTVHRNVLDLPFETGIISIQLSPGIHITDEVIERVVITNGGVCD